MNLKYFKNFKNFIAIGFLFYVPTVSVLGQDVSNFGFTSTKNIASSNIKNQGKTGTCWNFASTSLLESELMRMGKGNIDLSEMFIVRNIYVEKAQNYVRRQGKAQFDEGAMAHDLFRSIDVYGAMPESAYSGQQNGDKAHNHAEMVATLKGFLDGLLTQKEQGISQKWVVAFNGILDAYLGKIPQTFEHQGKTYTALQFRDFLGIKGSDYVNITSFTHHPFYEQVSVEVPDNFSNGLFYNVQLNELMEIVNGSLEKGYTVCWDADVSNKGFSRKDGIAIELINDTPSDKSFKEPETEKTITTELRQQRFDNLTTTDDHLMHLVGTANDKIGKKYYLTKNSWSENAGQKGIWYASEAYLMMNTVSIVVHKDALPKPIASKLKLIAGK